MLGSIKLSEIKNLTPLPVSVVRLAQIVSVPDSNLDDFYQVIEFDQALTANVLRWANSAWSQSRTPITSVKGAVIRLGTENILKLAIGYHLMGSMNESNQGYRLQEKELWRHSVAAALAAEHLPRFASRPIPPYSFAAALMHDIGKLIVGRHITSERLGKIEALMSTGVGLTYIEAEKQVLGTDHAEIGAAIAREWKIPDMLVKAIEFHHAPDKSQEPVLDAVHIANAIAKLIGQGLGTEQFNMRVSMDSAKRLGLDEQNIQILCALVKDQLEDTEANWKIV